MILHVCKNDKFIPGFLNFIGENFDPSEHRFFIHGDLNRFTLPPYSNLIVAKSKKMSLMDFLHLRNEINRSTKIIFHGLFDYRIIKFLFFQPWLLNKSYWVIWGGDLYNYFSPFKRRKKRKKVFFRRPVIRKIGHLVTYIKGDVDLAREWGQAGGVHHECLMYPSNLYKEIDTPKKEGNTTNILVGNSADPSNNHLDAFQKLIPYADHDIRIHVPLSYGNRVHAEKVIAAGTELFGDKFVPLVEFMPLEAYLEFLGQIDIAIFNHDRQQAMGNTITLLGMGKTVFMRTGLTSWDFLRGLQVQAFDLDNFSLDDIDESLATKNCQIIKSYFSRENLIRQLENLFN